MGSIVSTLPCLLCPRSRSRAIDTPSPRRACRQARVQVWPHHAPSHLAHDFLHPHPVRDSLHPPADINRCYVVLAPLLFSRGVQPDPEKYVPAWHGLHIVAPAATSWSSAAPGPSDSLETRTVRMYTFRNTYKLNEIVNTVKELLEHPNRSRMVTKIYYSQGHIRVNLLWTQYVAHQC